MSASAMYVGVRALYTADTGVGGLNHASAPLVTGFFIERAPIGQTLPYIVMSVQADTQDDTRSNNASLMEFALNLYTDANEGVGGALNLDTPVILARMRTVFHRSAVTAISGFTFSRLIRVSGRPIPDEDVQIHRFAELYRGWVFAA
jgi:hypothetical protein